jgi:hypothetical protein
VTLTTDTTLTDSGDITFVSTVDSDALGTPRSLTINTSSGTSEGNIFFEGAVGATFPLNAMNLTSHIVTAFDSTVNAASVTDTASATDFNGASVTTTGAQAYNNPVVLGTGTVTLSAGTNIAITGNVSGSGDVLDLTGTAAGNTFTLTGATLTNASIAVTGLPVV